MKISTRVRYGARLMVELGLHYGQGPFYLKQIAKIEDISEKYLSQIIIPLKKAGLVNSFRGAKGGYVLSRPPAKITMRQIVSVLDGDLNLVKCIKNSSSCSRVSACVTRGLWDNMGNTIRNMLDSVTLKNLVEQCKDVNKTAVSYCI
ncbi:MAG: Rrf2 family transcriptional regulator [Candidatus Omnitrophica bacterium]|nr:Rrf2 family transcriptional regulator [Candidatus Omnitrophota bacterium]